MSNVLWIDAADENYDGYDMAEVINKECKLALGAGKIIKDIKAGGRNAIEAKDKIVSSALGKIQELKNQIEEIAKLSIQAGIDHNTELKRLEVLLKEKQITQEQYDLAVQKENESYNEKIGDLEKLKEKLTRDLAALINDPYKKIKENRNKLKLKKLRRRKKNKAERAKARRDLARKVLKNAAKTLAPVIALGLANKFAAVLSQRAQLEKLVDQVNAYIEQANTPETFAIANNLRNNAVTLINNSIYKLTRLQQIINQIFDDVVFNLLFIKLFEQIKTQTYIEIRDQVQVQIYIEIRDQVQVQIKQNTL
jgi:hypothetical protein